MSFLTDLAGGFWATGQALAPSLFLGLFIAGLLHVFVRKERIFRHMGKPGAGSAVKASIIGIPLPLCSCGVLPAALSLRKEGASRGAVVSFLSSTPQTGVDSILPTWAMLGWPVALVKVLAAFISGVISGTAVDMIEGRKAVPEHRETPSPQEEGGILKRIWNYAFKTLFADIYLWLLGGIGVSVLIMLFVEPGQLSGYPLLSGPLGLLAALALGIPLYVCSVSSIPVAAALVHAGFPVGSALVFLLAGPVTNAATMGAVRRTLGKVSFNSYIISVTGISLLAGLLLNGLEIPAPLPPLQGHSEGSGLLPGVAAGLLYSGMIVLAVKGMLKKLRSSGKSEGSGGCECGVCER